MNETIENLSLQLKRNEAIRICSFLSGFLFADELFPKFIYRNFPMNNNFVERNLVADTFLVMRKDGWEIAFYTTPNGCTVDVFHKNNLCIHHDFKTTFEDVYEKLKVYDRKNQL